LLTAAIIAAAFFVAFDNLIPPMGG